MGACCVFLGSVVGFGFLLGDSFVVVAGGCLDEVVAWAEVDALGGDGRVENDFLELVGELGGCFTVVKGEFFWWDFADGLAKLFGGESWDELFTSVVVVYAVGEPYLLEVGEHGWVGGHVVVAIDGFECFPDAQVVAALLVGGDVTPCEGGLGEVVDIVFLAESELLEPVEPVAQHLDVGESLVGVSEGVVHFFLLGALCLSLYSRGVHPLTLPKAR